MDLFMKYKLIIFAFDGTLADSFPWFLDTLETVADEFDLKMVDINRLGELRKLDAANFIKKLKIPLYKIPQITTFMRSKMSEQIDDIKLYAGVNSMLKGLKEKGHKIAIVSTNSKDNINKVLGEELSVLNDYFVGGVSLFGKESKLKKVLKLASVSSQDAIYIGDEMRDIQASQKIDLPCGAVAWGFNDAESLAALHPTEMFYRVDQIIEKV